MHKQAWIEAAKRLGFEEFEIYEQRRTSTSIEVYEQKVDSYSISDCDGIALRGLYQGRMGSCFLEEVEDAEMEEVLEQMKRNAAVITSTDRIEILAPQKDYPKLLRKENELLSLDNEHKIRLLKKLEAALLHKDERIAQVMSTSYGETVVSRSIVNSKGMELSDSDTCSFVSVEVLAKEGEDAKSDHDWRYLHSLQELDVEKFAGRLCEKVCAKLHADIPESGSYPVLMDREAMSALFSALCSLFDGENAYKGISVLKDRLNEQIFAKSITVIDDPLLENGISSASFDDEGIACRKKIVVENGVLKTYLHNSKSASLMQTASTGNGFKAGYAGSVGIAPTNFFIENGESSYDEMIASMEKGIIVSSITGLHAGLNPVSTEFSLQSSGFYVEKGRIVKPVNLFTIAGNFMELMKEVSMVGNDLKFNAGGIGTPSILFARMAVSGK